MVYSWKFYWFLLRGAKICDLDFKLENFWWNWWVVKLATLSITGQPEFQGLGLNLWYSFQTLPVVIKHNLFGIILLILATIYWVLTERKDLCEALGCVVSLYLHKKIKYAKQMLLAQFYTKGTERLNNLPRDTQLRRVGRVGTRLEVRTVWLQTWALLLPGRVLPGFISQPCIVMWEGNRYAALLFKKAKIPPKCNLIVS